ncbi:alpha/beta hydrolase [Candidatus Parcubacteria bacterium]|nr:alpha/beta hydrolase [Patescibacteria group bacterium]MBU4309756.1 alpha/beta hydrolase [Patescibacteria group bacterium]MBU4431762.1 alpha/beta hydrolase [Patescibacteria group bacterium]MBU4578095.1 alpha/beta hydrolase [Patescibacteria group bacterium]MCG2696633.1 alpha/beta hydrolase [Candidatus Parcubacteria bacterium]
MSKRLFIIHGWEADPNSNWFPWLKLEASKLGFEVFVPAMPNTAHPVKDEWIAYLNKLVGVVDENTYFIGHSLGVIAILKFLEQVPVGQKAAVAILVAGFSESLGIPEVESFTNTLLDYEKVKQSAVKFIIYQSDNDPLIPLKSAVVMQEKFNADIIVIKNTDSPEDDLLQQGNHLCEGTGDFAFPEILDNLKDYKK